MNSNIYLSQVDITVDLNELINILKPDITDIIFIAGSLIENITNTNSKGMGNRLSDIDIFILRSKENFDLNTKVSTEEYNFGSQKVKFKKYMGLGVDIEYFNINDILFVINQLNKLDFNACDKNKRLANWIEVPTGLSLLSFLSFIHRLYYSIPLYNIEGYTNLKSSINFYNYFRYMVMFYTLKMDSRYTDVLGNMEVREYYVAIEGSREILRYAIMTYLFSINESIDREKWIPLKLKNISTINKENLSIYNRYVELMFATSLKNEIDYKKNIEDIINFSEYIINYVNTKVI